MTRSQNLQLKASRSPICAQRHTFCMGQVWQQETEAALAQKQERMNLGYHNPATLTSFCEKLLGAKTHAPFQTSPRFSLGVTNFCFKVRLQSPFVSIDRGPILPLTVGAFCGARLQKRRQLPGPRSCPA